MAGRARSAKGAIVLRVAIGLLVLGAGVYVLVRNWPTVSHSLSLARDADPIWLLGALLLMCLTFVIAAGIYSALALHPLRYRQTVLIEIATMFVGKLLPAGLGGLGLHGVYLYKRRHTAAEATAVVSVNNLVGMAAHLLLLLGVGLLSPVVFERLQLHVELDWRIALGSLLAVLAVLAAPVVRRRITQFLRNMWLSARKVRLHRLLRALGLAMLLTVTYTLMLLCSARSVGIELSLLQIFVVFTVGMLAGTASPTPGGLVGAEAGLFAGLTAYGVAAPDAGAVVLLFRLVSYWLPLVPGALALVAARRRQLV